MNRGLYPLRARDLAYTLVAAALAAWCAGVVMAAVAWTGLRRAVTGPQGAEVPFGPIPVYVPVSVDGERKGGAPR